MLIGTPKTIHLETEFYPRIILPLRPRRAQPHDRSYKLCHFHSPAKTFTKANITYALDYPLGLSAEIAKKNFTIFPLPSDVVDRSSSTQFQSFNCISPLLIWNNITKIIDIVGVKGIIKQ